MHIDDCVAPGSLIDPEEPLRGRGLRFLLLDELRSHGEMTVAEMVAVLSAHGFRFPGRASKVVSDALRWEVRAGRVARICRGVYHYVAMSRSRLRRVRLLARTSRRWVTDYRNGDVPPPFPRNKRPPPVPWSWSWHESPARPPWAHLGWLWTC